jgi:hypothetical protein
MRGLIVFMLVLLGAGAVALAGGSTDSAVTNPDVAQSAIQLVDAVRAGQWIGIASAAIWLVIGLLKLPALGGLIKKIPDRVRILLPILLGAAAGILASIAGGVPIVEAIWIGLFSGPGAVFAHEAVTKALLNKSSAATTPPT